jgi:hypothetical protein
VDHELEIVEAFPAWRAISCYFYKLRIVGGNSWNFYVSVWGAGDDSNHQGMKIDRGYISPYFITDTKAWPQRLIGWVALLRSGM